MVNFQKWLIIGAGLVFLGLFTKEAAATGLTGTLQRTGLSGQSIGGGLAAIGRGGGAGVSGLLSPFWELRNIIRGFMNLGSATPWLDDTTEQGGGTSSTTGDGGGTDSIPVSIISGSPDVYTTTGFSYYKPSWGGSPVTDVIVHGTSLPLSAAAIAYYKAQGVEVTVDEDGGGIHAESGGGGGTITVSGGAASIIGSSPSVTGWGQNVSTPSGGVASGNLSLSNWGSA